MPRDIAELQTLLDIEKIDDDLFRGGQLPTVLPRVFGGQVAAQGLVAAVRTVDPRYVPHSLHAYFLQGGDTSTPIIYDVEKLRDGRTFSTRRVLARQHGRPIFVMTIDLQHPEPGLEHQDVMPDDVTPPEECLDPKEGGRNLEEWDVMDFRYVGSSLDVLPVDPMRPGRQRMWLKVAQDLPDDPLVHAVAFTYASDMSIAGAALAPHGYRMGGPETMLASLDHAVWFHHGFRADQWWLYDQHSPFAGGGRGLVNARVFTQDGRLVASVAQEMMMREHRERPDA
ncbi:acyl-CoA thioesterase [Nocardioides acrostichi]|uniref:Acyl-CoA thioesterase 2 n=1 Tax=Nocardioides acrostichi TaxID=2784339 RepID=A0A930V0J5_9ACTN|nr:acyl-CoA thioesterase II [Nocardioides acrostichi]MBF4161014.1 acyl-CoA thioesterase II [Nocardioides acrostichi]